MRFILVLLLFIEDTKLEKETVEVVYIPTFEYKLTKEQMLIANVIHHETCHTEPFDGKIAIGNVILNRVGRKGFGGTVKSVV